MEGCPTCAPEIARLRGIEVTLTTAVKELSTTLANLTDDCGPDAPSLAIVYWLYGPTRWHTKSWQSEQNRLKPLLRSIGDLPAARLTPLVWSQHVARRKLEPDRHGNFPADVLLNQELGRAKQLLSWAVANRMIKFSPLSAARRVKAVSHRETWLPLGDVDRLLAACDDVVDKRLLEGDDDGTRALVMRAYVLCLHDPMLRPGEAMKVLLRPDRIGPDGRVELASRETKGAKRRTVFLTPRTTEAVRALPAFDPAKPLKRRKLSYWFRALCEVAGVDSLVAPGEKRVRPHDLRASAASTADEHGVRATAIRDALGHSKIATTEIYLRSGQASNARAATKGMTEAIEALAGRRPALHAPRKKATGDTNSRAKFLATKSRRA